MSIQSNVAVEFGVGPAGKASAPRLICLLVDDSRFDRRRVRYVADRSGLKIDFLEATTIAEAREILETRAIDFILLDNFLPDGQGLGLAEELTDRGLPVIMLSGQDENGLSEAAIWAGLSDFIQKDSLDPGAFGAIVQRVTRQSRVPAAAVAGPGADEADLPCTSLHQFHAPLSRLQIVLADLRAKAATAGCDSMRVPLAEAEGLCTDLSDLMETALSGQRRT